jgi:hypothetical protein
MSFGGGLNLQSGSVLVAGSDPDAASVTTIAPSNRGELNLVDGTVVFPVFGNNSASQIDNSPAYQQGILDLSGGTIAVQLEGGYEPEAGHVFDLLAGTTFDGSGNTTLSLLNISPTSYDGIWQIEWDTSQWLSDGILTVVSAKIPEPASFTLLALAGLALLRRRTRR